MMKGIKAMLADSLFWLLMLLAVTATGVMVVVNG